MTHRPIAPISIEGLTPGGTPRALPIFEMVKPETLLIDEGYQRDSSERSLKLVRKIVAGWDWARFKPPVAVLTDAGLELIDGQHTAIAAATHPDIAEIPVMIIEAPERADRAGAFISHNRDRVAVTVPQLHAAGLAAGDVDAMAVQRVGEKAAVLILRSHPGGAGKYPRGSTVSVAAIAALIKTRGEESAISVMAVLSKAGLAPINQTHIRAADLLLNDAEYATQMTADALVAAIKVMAPKIDAEAAVFRAAHPATPAWKAVAIIWFKARRGGALKSQPSDVAKLRNNATGGDLKTEGSSETSIPRSDLKTASGKLIENIDHRPRALLPPERKGESITGGAKKDAREELGRWQPGNHLRRCGPCGEPFVGGRRAEHCADCAYRAEEVESAAHPKVKVSA
jgi:hypothetical protein